MTSSVYTVALPLISMIYPYESTNALVWKNVAQAFELLGMEKKGLEA